MTRPPARAVAKSLETPLKQIAENAGLEGGVVVDKVRNLKGANGLNAATGDYEDLVKIGVIDAAKVTRSALQNAASIAALFLTTQAVIADKPEKEAPAMPGGGGMDDFSRQGGRETPPPLNPPTGGQRPGSKLPGLCAEITRLRQCALGVHRPRLPTAPLVGDPNLATAPQTSSVVLHLVTGSALPSSSVACRSWRGSGCSG